MAERASEKLKEVARTLELALSVESEEAYFIALDLLCDLLGFSRSTWLLHSEGRVLSCKESSLLSEQVARLCRYEPLQYVIGKAPFATFDLEVAEGVLIPRPETEELCSLVARELVDHRIQTFLDVGAGSGAISLYLAKSFKGSQGFSLERSLKAFPILQRNINTYQKEIFPSTIELIQGDLFAPDTFGSLLPPLDLLVSNPPYVMQEERFEMKKNVLLYEPEEALFAPQDDPLYFYRGILALCERLPFSPLASVYLELNARLARETQVLFTRSKLFSKVEICEDLFRRPRFLKAKLL